MDKEKLQKRGPKPIKRVCVHDKSRSTFKLPRGRPDVVREESMRTTLKSVTPEGFKSEGRVDESR